MAANTVRHGFLCNYIISNVHAENIHSILCILMDSSFTNSVDPDEMQHYAALHLGLHCLHKYSFMEFPEYKGLRIMKTLS